MIKVTSANNREYFFVNHNKIKTLKEVNSFVHILLEDEQKFIVTETIDEIINKIIEFENSIIYLNKSNPNIIEEVSINE